MLRHALVTCAAALLLGSAPLSAQTAHRFSVQGSGLYESFSGVLGDGFEDGFGGEIQLRFSPSSFSIGAGLQLTQHELKQFLKEDLGIPDADFSFRFTGVFIEPRLVILTGSEQIAPYLSLRASWSQVDAQSGGEQIDVDSGWGFNGGGGILINVSSRVNLDVGATYGVYSVDFVEDRHQNLVVRVGLAVGLGG